MVTGLLSLKKRLFSALKDCTWISNPRVLWGIFLASTLPPLLLGCYYRSASLKIERMEQEIARLERKHRPLMQLKRQREKMAEEIGTLETGYIQRALERISFLEPDAALLAKIQKTHDYKPVRDRLIFLTGEENKMKFRKTQVRKKGPFQEAVWTLDHPVETSGVDIKRVLMTIVEAKAHLAIKKCVVYKKNQFYTLDLELLERSIGENEI